MLWSRDWNHPLVIPFIVKFKLVENVQEHTKIKQGNTLMTKSQQKWIWKKQIMSQFESKHYNYDSSSCQTNCCHWFEIAVSKEFEIFMMICVVLNLVTMAIQHYPQSQTFTTVINLIQTLMIGIFTMEMIVKTIGLGWNCYWKDDWNKFDFCVLILSYIGCIYFGSSYHRNVNFQSTRILRVACTFKKSRKMRYPDLIFRTFLYSLPSPLNMVLTLSVIFYIYAIIGMNLFSLRFDSFTVSLYTLFICLTGDSWTIPIHHTILNQGYAITAIYFMSFYFICSLLIVNLFIGAIRQIFNDNIRFDADGDYLIGMKQFELCLKRFTFFLRLCLKRLY